MTDPVSLPSSPTAGLLRETPGGGALLLGHRCAECGVLGFPRVAVCGSCGSSEVGEVELGGTGGTLFGWTVVSAAPPGYAGPLPYGFGVVDLDEGLRVLGRVTGFDVADPEALGFGQRMRCVVDVVARDGADPLAVWAFAPADEGAGR